MPTLTKRFRGPFRGVNKAVDSSFLDVLDAEDALNLILDQGTLRQREGFVSAVQFSGATDGPILGTFDFLQNDGTLRTLVKSGQNLYRATISGGVWTTTLLSSGLVDSMRASFATLNNKCYFCDGSVLKVTDAVSVFTANIPAPVNPPTVAAQAYGGTNIPLTGEYDWKHTYYSTVWAQESQASAASVQKVLAAQQALLTFPNVPADTRIDRIRVYRRKTSVGGSLWFLIAEVVVTPSQVAPTFTDRVIDQDVQVNTIAPVLTTTQQDFKFLAQQNGVLFLAGSAAFPTRLYYTRPNEPYVLQGFEEIGSGGDNEAITGLMAYQGIVVVFKTNSIWILSGDTAKTFFASKVVPNVGCRSNSSIVNEGDYLYFLSEDGFREFDGQRTRIISDPIKPDLMARNFSRDAQCVGVNDYQRGMILWSYASSGSNSNDKMVGYFYRNARQVEFDSWCPWRIQADQASDLALVGDGNTRVKSLVFGLATGRMGIYGGDSDEGDPIPILWRTGKTTFGFPEFKKIWKEFTLQTRLRSAFTQLDIFYYLDGDGPFLKGGTDFSKEIWRVRVNRSSKEIRLEFSGAYVGGAEIIGWTLEGEAGENA